MTTTRVETGLEGPMEEVVWALLPKQTGYVEVQYDSPYQEHPTHTYPTDAVSLTMPKRGTNRH